MNRILVVGITLLAVVLGTAVTAENVRAKNVRSGHLRPGALPARYLCSRNVQAQVRPAGQTEGPEGKQDLLCSRYLRTGDLCSSRLRTGGLRTGLCTCCLRAGRVSARLRSIDLLPEEALPTTLPSKDLLPVGLLRVSLCFVSLCFISLYTG